jgi:TRAP-type C4-dicarboxylate transport system substrate-binding protein
MRALRILGLLANSDETSAVLSRLKTRIADEAHAHGFAILGMVPIGPHILLTRTPVRTLDDLRRVRFWVWDRDDVMRLELPTLGVKFEPLPIEAAARAYEENRVDGFITPASVALAFQWSAQARYATDLRLDFISGCLALTERAFDPLPTDVKQAIRAAGAKLTARFTEVSTQIDAQLLGSLFQRQGVQVLPPGPTLRADFFQAAQDARVRLAEQLAPSALLSSILTVLADYRAEHAHDAQTNRNR